jgi:hypothetical protein
MTEYYLPSKYHHLHRYGDKIASENILCDVNINDLHDDMYKRLQQCHLSVYGYDNINEKYWGKKIHKTCYMSFTISIKKKTNNHSLMTIDVFIDDKSEIKNIINTMSSHAECILNTECGLIQRIKPNAHIQRIKPMSSTNSVM